MTCQYPSGSFIFIMAPHGLLAFAQEGRNVDHVAGGSVATAARQIQSLRVEAAHMALQARIAILLALRGLRFRLRHGQAARGVSTLAARRWQRLLVEIEKVLADIAHIIDDGRARLLWRQRRGDRRLALPCY